jgi:hypothetical protein
MARAELSGLHVHSIPFQFNLNETASDNYSKNMKIFHIMVINLNIWVKEKQLDATCLFVKFDGIAMQGNLNHIPAVRAILSISSIISLKCGHVKEVVCVRFV